MQTCTVETGLLKKKPCGHNAVTHCGNCEQPLCKQHAVAQKTAGKFMCKECDAARRAYEKNTPPAPVKSPAPPAAPDAAKHAAPKDAPKEAPNAAAPAKVDDGGALEYTPGTQKK